MQTAAGNKRYNGQGAASPNGPAGKLGLYVGVGMLCLMCAWSFFQCQTNRSSSIAVVAREATTTTTAGASSAAAMLLPSVAAFTNPLPGPSPPDRRISYAQLNQDTHVAKILNNMTGGFFVESGAFDGVHISNSWYLETQLGWKGLLVEANPHLYRKIIDKSRRNVSVIHSCLSPVNQPTVLPFRLAGPVGGLVDHMSENHIKRVDREVSNKEPWMTGESGSGKVMNVSCWPLHSMLKVLGVDRVDYWSLDTEGSEPQILAATDFDAIDIRVMTIEVSDAVAEKKVKDFFATRPEYKLHSKVEFDLVYVKNNVMLPTP